MLSFHVKYIIDAGATTYHIHRESAYFNFDNIFATALFVLYSYTWLSSYRTVHWYFAVGAVGQPIALIFLVFCGSPAIVEYDTNGKPSKRVDNLNYHIPHVVWHIITACGNLLLTLFIISYPDELYSTDYLNMSTMMVYSLILGITLNITLNVQGLAPLD